MAVLKDFVSHNKRIILILLGIFLIAAASFIGLTDNLPAIFLFLLGWFVFFFGIIYGIGKSKNLSFGKKLLYWSPRIFSFVFLLFASLFALDVFDGSKGFWETLLAFIIHLVPVLLMAAILVVSWKREWIAAIIFPIIGVYNIIMAWDRHFPAVTYLVIAGPLFLIGLLFYLNWKNKSTFRPLH